MKLRHNVKNLNITTSLLWLIPLVISLILLPIRGTNVTPDSSTYLALASDIFSGNGYVYPDGEPAIFRGPVYSSLLALGFYIFGYSVKSALWITRIFYVLNIMLLYIAGCKIFNRKVGLVVSLLALTSLILYQWSTRVHLDNIVPFFILASNLVVFVGFETGRKRYFMLSGLLLGIAYVTKDTAVLSVALPFFLWLIVSDYRTKFNIKGLVLFSFSFMAIVAPWLFYVYNIDGLSRMATMASWVLSRGVQGDNVGLSVSIINEVGVLEQYSNLLFSWLTSFWDRLVEYYQIYIQRQFTLAPLLILAWIYVIYQAIFNNSRADRFLATLLLLFMPLVLFFGSVTMRVGQNFYLYLISYLALAHFVCDLTSKLHWHRLWSATLIVSCLVIQIISGPHAFVRLFYPVTSSGYASQAGVYSPSLGNSQFDVDGWHQPFIVEAGTWLNEHLNPDDIVLADWEWGHSLYFYHQKPTYKIEYVSSQDMNNFKDKDIAPVFFLWMLAGQTNPNVPYSHMMAFSEPTFLSQIENLKPKYVIFGKQHNFLSFYLRSHPNFTEVAQFGNSQIQIFQVSPPTDGIGSIPFDLHVSQHVSGYLSNLQLMDSPSAYNQFVEQYLHQILQIDPLEIRKIETGHSNKFQFDQIVTPYNYARWLQRIPQQNEVIIKYKNEIALYPDNLWSKLTLSSIYTLKNQHDFAMPLYTQLLPSLPTEPLVRTTMLQIIDQLGEDASTQQYSQELSDKLSDIYEIPLDVNKSSVESYQELAQWYETIQEPHQILNVYQQALKRWPMDAELYFQLGQHYARQSDFANAKSNYLKAIELDPLMREVYVGLNQLSWNIIENTDRAKRYELATKNAERPWLYIELGKLYLEQMKQIGTYQEEGTAPNP